MITWLSDYKNTTATKNNKKAHHYFNFTASFQLISHKKNKRRNQINIIVGLVADRRKTGNWSLLHFKIAEAIVAELSFKTVDGA